MHNYIGILSPPTGGDAFRPSSLLATLCNRVQIEFAFVSSVTRASITNVRHWTHVLARDNIVLCNTLIAMFAMTVSVWSLDLLTSLLHIILVLTARLFVACLPVLVVTVATSYILFLSLYWMYYKQIRVYVRDVASSFIYVYRHECPQWIGRNRQGFKETILAKSNKNSNLLHTHGESASSRTNASAFIDQFSMLSGFTGYFVQMSQADVNRGREGSRSVHWTKDTGVEPRKYDPKSHHMIAYVDVDYYVDMNEALLNHFQPVVIYSIQPQEVAGDHKDFSYTFNEKSELVYKVTGGGNYVHELWNYNVECVKVKGWTIMNGKPVFTVRSYTIERKYAGGVHQLILLNPDKAYYGFVAWVADKLMAGNELDRYAVTNGEYTIMASHSTEGHFVSIGRVNEYNSGRVSRAQFDGIMTLARSNKLNIKTHQVEGVTQNLTKIQALAITEFASSVVPHKIMYTAPNENFINHYDPNHYRLDECKPSLQAFASPFIEGGTYAPVQSEESEQVAVDGRINKVRTPYKAATTFEIKTMTEFVKLFCGDTILQPVSVDEVYNRQDRPSQRMTLDKSWFTKLINSRLATFLKKEAYDGPKDPRIISTQDGKLKLDYSRYIYSLADYMKTSCDWYGFGLTPREVGQKVAAVAMKAERHIINSDLSRFDGHIGNMARDLERMILMSMFDAAHSNELTELHSAQFNTRATTTHGISYETKFARASGSPETSVFNTIFNKYLAYHALRLSSYPAATAYNWPGLYGGDDGITADIDRDFYVKAATSFGQTLTIDAVQRGGRGVTFLARYYTSGVWFGDENNCCDLKRQLAKWHTTAASSVVPIEKLHAKMLSFKSSDASTPVFGTMISKFFELYEHELPDRAKKFLSYHYHDEKENQYINEPSDEFLQLLEEQLPGWDMGVFDNYVSQCTKAEQFLTMPVCVEPIAPIPAAQPYLLNFQEVISPRPDPVKVEEEQVDEAVEQSAPEIIVESEQIKDKEVTPEVKEVIVEDAKLVEDGFTLVVAKQNKANPKAKAAAGKQVASPPSEGIKKKYVKKEQGSKPKGNKNQQGVMPLAGDTDGVNKPSKTSEPHSDALDVKTDAPTAMSRTRAKKQLYWKLRLEKCIKEGIKSPFDPADHTKGADKTSPSKAGPANRRGRTKSRAPEPVPKVS